MTTAQLSSITELKPIRPCCPLCNQKMPLQFQNTPFFITEDALFVEGRPVNFTPNEFNIFLLLWKNFGKVMTRERVYDHVYMNYSPDYGRVEIKILDVWLCKVRQKLRKFAVPLHVDTIWGRGWMMQNGAEQ